MIDYQLTYEEAIHHLRCGRILTDKDEDDKLRRMCIEALEKQNEIVHCKDCKNWGKSAPDGVLAEVGGICYEAGWLCGEQGFCMYGMKVK